MLTYKVRSGDTLGKIARRFYGDPSRFHLIVAANSISNPDKIPVGKELVIPDLNVALAPAALTVSPTASRAARATVAGPASVSERRLAQVHPALASRGRRMIDLCAQAGVAVLVTQGVRTWDEQDNLYAKGRTIPPRGTKYIVTKAKGGQSYHNFGLAFDIAVLDALGKMDWDVKHPGWKKAAEIGKSLGLEWGGDWKTFKDRPHFQYVGGLTLAQCRELMSASMQAVWSEIA